MLFIDSSILKTPTEMRHRLYTYSVIQIKLQSILINTGWYRRTGYIATSCFIKGIFIFKNISHFGGKYENNKKYIEIYSEKIIIKFQMSCV